MFYKAFKSFTASPECFLRIQPSNIIMKKIIQLYDADVSAAKGVTSVLVNTAIPRYLIRALHWGTLALDFTDDEFATVWDLYYASIIGPAGERVLCLVYYKIILFMIYIKPQTGCLEPTFSVLYSATYSAILYIVNLCNQLTNTTHRIKSSAVSSTRIFGCFPF